MSYKVKSLVYFSCFLASAFTYYTIGDDSQIENNNQEIAELSMEHIVPEKTTEIK